jgi:nitronate monooxygenase
MTSTANARGEVAKLRVPLVAAPMLGVSTPDLVAAACTAGIAGAFPTANCTSTAQLVEWLEEIDSRIPRGPVDGQRAGLVCANLIVHRSNPRLDADLQAVSDSSADIVITSVGWPVDVVKALRRSGQSVWADVASVRHLERAIEAGVDGVVLLAAGAGGQTGWANPFAFTRLARRIFEGTIALAGGISDGAGVAAAELLGADLAYSGTRFLGTKESGASPAYKQALRQARMDDVVLTNEITGLPANVLATSPSGTSQRGVGSFDVETTLAGANGGGGNKDSRWSDVWSAGHGVGLIDDLPTVAGLVTDFEAQWRQAKF